MCARPRQFGATGENVRFAYSLANGDGGQQPVRYRVVRLEDQSDFGGKLGTGKDFEVNFKQSGSYSVELLDKHDNLIGATNYWVQGKDLQAAPLSVEIVPDKTQCNIGDTAQVLLTFPVPVQDALLTLERENVAQHGLLSQTGSWAQVKNCRTSNTNCPSLLLPTWRRTWRCRCYTNTTTNMRLKTPAWWWPNRNWHQHTGRPNHLQTQAASQPRHLNLV